MCVRKNLVIFRQPKDKKFRYTKCKINQIRLLDQVRNVLRLKHYSYCTEEEVSQFLTWLAAKKKVAVRLEFYPKSIADFGSADKLVSASKLC